MRVLSVLWCLLLVAACSKAGDEVVRDDTGASKRTGDTGASKPTGDTGTSSSTGDTGTGTGGLSPVVEMVQIPGGLFTMGSPKTEEGRFPDEGPQHEVTVSSFWVMETEVTQELWAEVMGDNPSANSGCGPSCPVDSVIWEDAVAFANQLSIRHGLSEAYEVTGKGVEWDSGSSGYRLLTEAEWEYAARGGEGFVYAGSSELEDVGWVNSNSGSTPHPVCLKARNGFGLCDMSGNVMEWVWDWYGDYTSDSQRDPWGPAGGSIRVIRGGSWNYSARDARVAYRDWGRPGDRFGGVGFRLARPAP